MELKNKVALITGASGGLGKGFADILLENGAQVCLVDLNDELGKSTLKEFQTKFGQDKVTFSKCDVTDEDDFRGAFIKTKETFGRLDIMINNAGIMSEGRWKKMIEVNLVAMIQGTLLAKEFMSKDSGGDGGIIVNISSGAGLEPGYHMPAYCASKAGILLYTRSWAMAPTNVQTGLKFCALCPGMVQTPIVNFTEESFINIDYATVLRKTAERSKLSVPDVAVGLLALLKNPTNNGAVMKVTLDGGIEYVYEASPKM